MKKRKFVPNTVVRNLKEDFKLNADINVEFWEDPSRPIIRDLFSFIGTRQDGLDEMSEEEINAMNARYFECASKVLIDCDIEGIDFSTPQKAEDSFYHEDIPWGIFHEALACYIQELMERYDALKNVLRRVKELSNSGQNNDSKENE